MFAKFYHPTWDLPTGRGNITKLKICCKPFFLCKDPGQKVFRKEISKNYLPFTETLLASKNNIKYHKDISGPQILNVFNFRVANM